MLNALALRDVARKRRAHQFKRDGLRAGGVAIYKNANNTNAVKVNLPMAGQVPANGHLGKHLILLRV